MLPDDTRTEYTILHRSGNKCLNIYSQSPSRTDSNNKCHRTSVTTDHLASSNTWSPRGESHYSDHLASSNTWNPRGESRFSDHLASSNTWNPRGESRFSDHLASSNTWNPRGESHLSDHLASSNTWNPRGESHLTDHLASSNTWNPRGESQAASKQTAILGSDTTCHGLSPRSTRSLGRATFDTVLSRPNQSCPRTNAILALGSLGHKAERHLSKPRLGKVSRVPEQICPQPRKQSVSLKPSSCPSSQKPRP
ncbi:hypothetical protein GQ457_12G011170 [Hibiscus cannabinus]